MRGVVLVAAALAISVCVAGASARAGQRISLSDTYSVYRPASLSRAQPVPLVVGCCIGAALEAQTRLNEAADRYAFVVAYLAPNRLYNDAERQRGPGTPFPDIQYLTSLIDKLRVSENVDPQRVYVTGASSGGIFSYRAACYLSDRIAAIGSVAGTDVSPPCRPKAPVSVIEIHELNDPFEPYSGTSITPSTPAVVAKWRSVDQCSTSSTTTTMPGVTDQSWTKCANGTGVQLISVSGSGHGWIRKNGVDATTAIWRFFAAHPKRQAAATPLSVRLTKVRVVYRPRRRVLVSLSLGQNSTVAASLRRASRVFAKKTGNASAGPFALSLNVPASARPGSYVLVVVAKNSGGVRQIARTLHLSR